MLLATSLSVDTAAALREHGSATLDEHYGRSLPTHRRSRSAGDAE
jgi:hypothetical protein